MKLLRIENCTIGYRGGTTAVKNVSFDIEQGELVCIVGESGSGKTTLIRAILGLLPSGGKILSGNIFMGEKDLTSLSQKEWNPIRGKEIAMIFQNSGASLDPIQKVFPQYEESIKVHDKKITRTTCKEIASKMLELLHLKDVPRVLNSYPCQLSGGMNQRVGIAMAITSSPKLLLADEPTSALDVTVQAQVVRQIKELKTQLNTTVLMVTHNMGVASYLSDKIIVMKDGEVVEWGPRDEIIFNPKTEYTKSLLSAVPVLKNKSKEGVHHHDRHN